MLDALRKRLGRDDEQGFTLIELMVVVLIIAILIAIAIPTFLGARQRSQDRAAQSNLRNAYSAEKVIYTDNSTYTSAVTALTAIEPSLQFEAAAAVSDNSSAKMISVVLADSNTTVMLGAKSKSGKCFYIRDKASGTATQFAESANCAAVSDSLTWKSEW